MGITRGAPRSGGTLAPAARGSQCGGHSGTIGIAVAPLAKNRRQGIPGNMMLRTLVFAGVLTFAAGLSAAQAAANSLPPDPMAAGLNAADRLQALIDRVKYEQSKLTTLEASFSQRRESELLGEPEESP